VASLAAGSAGGAAATLVLQDGTAVTARRAVVVAVEGPEAGVCACICCYDGLLCTHADGLLQRPTAARLVPDALAASPSATGPGVGTVRSHAQLRDCLVCVRLTFCFVLLRALPQVCVYFDAPRAPRGEPILYLNGDGAGAHRACSTQASVRCLR
jgi:hypothetical protein